MVTSQKPAAPVASPNAKANQPAARPAPPTAAAHPTPSTGGPDSNCAVHRLEESLQCVESMHLTDDQKAKISQLTKAQSARCDEEKKHHQATHAQILALLNPDQKQQLEAMAESAAHCHQGSPAATEANAVHA